MDFHGKKTSGESPTAATPGRCAGVVLRGLFALHGGGGSSRRASGTGATLRGSVKMSDLADVMTFDSIDLHIYIYIHIC